MPTPTGLQAIGIRFRGVQPDTEDNRCLDAYLAHDVYSRAGLPVDYVEPAFPEARRFAEETDSLGLLGGQIAQKVAEARQSGQAVLMTGGDCTHITGVVGGLQQAAGADSRIGLVWFDAHGDINTPQTTLTGSLGGMPVAVCAGLAFPRWRIGSGIRSPLPADHILMVDVRNLDPAEAQFLNMADIPIAAAAPGFSGRDLPAEIERLAAHVNQIYLHVDSDILDASLVPNHGTREPNGPDLSQVQKAIQLVMATGKVSAFAVVSVYGGEPGRERSIESGIGLISAGLERWKTNGVPPNQPTD
jgi:arginase